MNITVTGDVDLTKGFTILQWFDPAERTATFRMYGFDVIFHDRDEAFSYPEKYTIWSCMMRLFSKERQNSNTSLLREMLMEEFIANANRS